MPLSIELCNAPIAVRDAQAEVAANLALLDKQSAEANNRLATTVGQGGPNFVQNAILGPLADKRRATIDRIAIAIGRHAARPSGLVWKRTMTCGRPMVPSMVAISTAQVPSSG